MIKKCGNDRESYDDRKCDNMTGRATGCFKNGPKYRSLALFSCWMVLYGPKRYLMIRAYRCIALDTPLAYILEKKCWDPTWGHKTKGIGSNGAFWGPWPLKKGPTSGQSVW